MSDILVNEIKKYLQNGDTLAAKVMFEEMIDDDARQQLLHDKSFFQTMVTDINYDAVETLIKFGVDVNQTLDKAMSALGWAAFSEENFQSRLRMIQLLLDNGADETMACTCHGHILCETIYLEKFRMFEFFLDRVHTIDELNNAVDDNGKKIDFFVAKCGKPEIIKAFQDKKTYLKGGAQPKSPYLKTDDHTIEMSKMLDGGIRLTEVYNFQSARRMTITKTHNALNTQIEYFSDIIDPNPVLDAAEELTKLGGDPGRGWQRKLIYRAVEKKPDTAKKPG